MYTAIGDSARSVVKDITTDDTEHLSKIIPRLLRVSFSLKRQYAPPLNRQPPSAAAAATILFVLVTIRMRAYIFIMNKV